MFRFPLRDDAELRILEMRHAEALHALIMANLDRLSDWFYWAFPERELVHTKGFIYQGLQRYANEGTFEAGIWYRGEIAGVIAAHELDNINQLCSIGYWLGTGYEGKGLVTDACRAIVSYLFTELKLQRVEISHAVENVRSRNVIERVGFRYEGVKRGSLRIGDAFVDQLTYGMTRADWEA